MLKRIGDNVTKRFANSIVQKNLTCSQKSTRKGCLDTPQFLSAIVGHPMEKISEFIDLHFRPRVEYLPPYLKDTTDYLNKTPSSVYIQMLLPCCTLISRTLKVLRQAVRFGSVEQFSIHHLNHYSISLNMFSS